MGQLDDTRESLDEQQAAEKTYTEMDQTAPALIEHIRANYSEATEEEVLKLAGVIDSWSRRMVGEERQREVQAAE
jgi:hypothetical protein